MLSLLVSRKHSRHPVKDRRWSRGAGERGDPKDELCSMPLYLGWNGIYQVQDRCCRGLKLNWTYPCYLTDVMIVSFVITVSSMMLLTEMVLLLSFSYYYDSSLAPLLRPAYSFFSSLAIAFKVVPKPQPRHLLFFIFFFFVSFFYSSIYLFIN